MPLLYDVFPRRERESPQSVHAGKEHLFQILSLSFIYERRAERAAAQTCRKKSRVASRVAPCLNSQPIHHALSKSKEA
jgi:hypothetical protein